MICAGCMVLTLVGTANAAEPTSKNAISTFAGKIMKVQVVNATFDGVTKDTYIVDVPIPANATKTTQQNLVQSAVGQAQSSRAADSAVSLIANSSLFETISTDDDISLVSLTYMSVGGGTLTKEYKSLLVYFDGPFTTMNGANTLLVRVNNSYHPTLDYDLSVSVNQNSIDAYVCYISGTTYPNDAIFMENGATLSVYAKPDAGGLWCESCTVSASIYDIS